MAIELESACVVCGLPAGPVAQLRRIVSVVGEGGIVHDMWCHLFDTEMAPVWRTYTIGTGRFDAG